jgi:murein DD-endopeptidase MepM/ murein hydrolase activator NlpD
MVVPFAPTAFPSGGRQYLMYELRVTNLSADSIVIDRLETRDARRDTTPLASFAGSDLDAILQHFANPAVGDRMPSAGDDYRRVAAGESVIFFLSIELDGNARSPGELSHRLTTADSSIEGAVVSTRAVKLRVLGPPLQGGIWQAYAGAGNNTSHHRRQFMVLGGHMALPTRYAIDWKRVENGVNSSGAQDDNYAYFSYRQPVLAVADATVIAVRNDIHDNKPGHVGAEALGISTDTIGGNTIVLDLEGGQFAHYMHLTPGSVRVKAGDRVRRGEVIALVGNSGSSFEPHLHFHVTTSAGPISGEGLPYLIDEYAVISDGARQRRRGELPVEGMLVDFGTR